MSVHQQNPDGSWTPAEPLPYFDGVDWEISGKGREREAVAYWHADEIGRVKPGPWFRLRFALAVHRLREYARR